MDFNFQRSRADAISKERVLEELERFSARRGNVEFARRDFIGAAISERPVLRCFGTWSKAMGALREHLRQKGIDLRKHRRSDSYADSKLYQELERVWRHYGHRPSRDEWEKGLLSR